MVHCPLPYFLGRYFTQTHILMGVMFNQVFLPLNYMGVLYYYMGVLATIYSFYWKLPGDIFIISVTKRNHIYSCSNILWKSLTNMVCIAGHFLITRHWNELQICSTLHILNISLVSGCYLSKGLSKGLFKLIIISLHMEWLQKEHCIRIIFERQHEWLGFTLFALQSRLELDVIF